MGKRYELGACMKGNGTTVYNRAEEENGDYKNVAHISESGEITYWEENLPDSVKKQIELYRFFESQEKKYNHKK